MRPITQEWVDKAEDDFNMVRRELRARKAPSYDGACFHAQQCAEKYLKGRLYEASISFPKTHDLMALLALVLPVEPLWSVLVPNLAGLNPFAVRFRYPGDSADRDKAKQALKDCRLVREQVRRSLGLPPA